MNHMTQENPIQKKINIKVIALAVVCVILAASLVGVLALYLPNQSQMAEKDNTINSLNQQIADLEFNLSRIPDPTTYALQIAYLNSQIGDLNETLTSISADYSTLQSIVGLSKSGILYDNTLTQDHNVKTTIWNEQLDYAGYIVVQVSASSSTTYAEVLYTYGEVNFDFNQTLGTAGTTLFPVLPGIVEVKIGNTMASDTNNATVTATYWY